MNLNEYQNEALKTAEYPQVDLLFHGHEDKKEGDYLYLVLGLVGEAGEVAEKVKRVIRSDSGEMSPETKLAIIKEVSDVLWYCAVLADEFGFTLDEMANINIEKLRDRKARGVIRSTGDER